MSLLCVGGKDTKEKKTPKPSVLFDKMFNGGSCRSPRGWQLRGKVSKKAFIAAENPPLPLSDSTDAVSFREPPPPPPLIHAWAGGRRRRIRKSPCRTAPLPFTKGILAVSWQEARVTPLARPPPPPPKSDASPPPTSNHTPEKHLMMLTLCSLWLCGINKLHRKVTPQLHTQKEVKPETRSV